MFHNDAKQVFLFKKLIISNLKLRQSFSIGGFLHTLG